MKELMAIALIVTSIASCTAIKIVSDNQQVIEMAEKNLCQYEFKWNPCTEK